MDGPFAEIAGLLLVSAARPGSAGSERKAGSTRWSRSAASRSAGAVRDAAHRDVLKSDGVAHILEPFDDAADGAAEELARTIRGGNTPGRPAAAGRAA